jgi:hypothetical protein
MKRMEMKATQNKENHTIRKKDDDNYLAAIKGGKTKRQGKQPMIDRKFTKVKRENDNIHVIHNITGNDHNRGNSNGLTKINGIGSKGDMGNNDVTGAA